MEGEAMQESAQHGDVPTVAAPFTDVSQAGEVAAPMPSAAALPAAPPTTTEAPYEEEAPILTGEGKPLSKTSTGVSRDPKTGRPVLAAQHGKRVSYTGLYRFATSYDYVLIIFGLLFAIIAGAGTFLNGKIAVLTSLPLKVMPLMSVVFGGLIDTFTRFQIGVLDAEAMRGQVNQ